MAVGREACALCRIQYVQHCPFVEYPCPVSPRSGVPRKGQSETYVLCNGGSFNFTTNQPSKLSVDSPRLSTQGVLVLPNKVLESFGVKASPNKTGHGMLLVGRLLLYRPPLQ